ncbi:tyrosine-type recombinase/integrase [Pannus brasiliensis CCIBt3594]|uniref:Tyrosine-type recombinase/integrase n=1 Tax=Pannus brasiliensis CCIBt3594 TaxID=1427578 RepID=A0AAW9R1T3_9CHRO
MNTTKRVFCCVGMTLTTYPRLTDAATDEELIRFWLSDKSKTTRKTYRTIARQFLEFTGKPLADTRIEDILLWLESYQLRSASRNTVINKLAAIRSLFGFGMGTGYLAADPTKMIKSPKAIDALNERLLIEEEVKRLIEATEPGRDRAIVKLLYVLGLRISELTGLNWNDFRENNDGATVTIRGKGSKTRTLLLDRSLWDEIRQLPRGEKTTAVFLSRLGNRLDRHAIHRMIKKAVEAAGINPHTSAHWLRHAHACHSLKHGAGIELLRKSLGHSSLATTSRYLHVNPDECTSQFIRLE